MSDQSILWRRVDQPGHESARLWFEDSYWTLAGAAVFLYDKRPCRLDYLVFCDSAWHTQGARVEGWVGGETVDITIEVDSAGRWWFNDSECPEVASCCDIDLGFSPSTNLLPIRRLNLEVGSEAQVRAAWLRFPTLRLELLEQVYRRLDRDVYRYESAGGKFVRDLQVNETGLVTVYPDFWEVERAE